MSNDRIKELIERLEKASGPDRELNGAIFWIVERRRAQNSYWNVTPGKPQPIDELPVKGLGKLAVEVSAPAYTASIDAALTLVPEGWFGDVRLGGERSFAWLKGDNTDPGTGLLIGNTPAIALCIAALRAIASQPHKDAGGGE